MASERLEVDMGVERIRLVGENKLLVECKGRENKAKFNGKQIMGGCELLDLG